MALWSLLSHFTLSALARRAPASAVNCPLCEGLLAGFFLLLRGGSFSESDVLNTNFKLSPVFCAAFYLFPGIVFPRPRTSGRKPRKRF